MEIKSVGIKKINGSITNPKGFYATGSHIGIKDYKKDLALIYSQLVFLLLISLKHPQFYGIRTLPKIQMGQEQLLLIAEMQTLVQGRSGLNIQS